MLLSEEASIQNMSENLGINQLVSHLQSFGKTLTPFHIFLQI